MNFEREIPLKKYKFCDYKNFKKILKKILEMICCGSCEIDAKIVRKEYAIYFKKTSEFLNYFENNEEFYSFHLTVKNTSFEAKFDMYTFENLRNKTKLKVTSSDKSIIDE